MNLKQIRTLTQAHLKDLPASDLKWLARHNCEHHRPFLTHPSCYTPKGTEEKIGFLDVETEALEADYGILFTYAISDEKGKIYHDTITKEDIKKWGKEAKEDTRLIKNLIRDMGNFDRLVGHFSGYFDFPFIRTRAVMCGVDYPKYGVYSQSDTWRILKNKFKLSRNSLESGTRNLLGKTRKNHLSLRLKHGCLRGDKKCLDETLEHNDRDVLDTKDLFKVISPFARQTQTSI